MPAISQQTFSTMLPTSLTQTDMQSLADRYFDAIHSLMFHIATILGFWVGVVTFFARNLREWYNNGGKQDIARLSLTVLHFINSKSESLYYSIEDSADLVREV